MNHALSQSPSRTIYSDFVEYAGREEAEPTAEEITNHTVFIIDTNVLLNLFKFSRSTTEEVLTALRSMKDVLFLPHHALKEFWPLLEEVRRGVHHREAKGKIDKSIEDVKRDVNTWLVRSGFDPFEDRSSDSELSSSEHESVSGEIWSELQKAEEAVSAIKTVIDRVSSEAELDEEILQVLEEIFSGKVGDAPNEDELTQLFLTFESRIANDIPPGNRDLVKGSTEKAIGDFLIWHQSLQEMTRRSQESGKPWNLTLVTNDLKDDWVRARTSNDLYLPRRELIREYADVAGGVFRINTFKQLGRIAKTHFGAELTDASIDELDPVSERGMWQEKPAAVYLDLLRNSYPDQFVVLLVSYLLVQDGLDPLSFSEVKEITRRPNIVGFSKPYSSIMNASQFREIARDTEEPMLSSVYRTNGLPPWYELSPGATPVLESYIAAAPEVPFRVNDAFRHVQRLRRRSS